MIFPWTQSQVPELFQDRFASEFRQDHRWELSTLNTSSASYMNLALVLGSGRKGRKSGMTLLLFMIFLHIRMLLYLFVFLHIRMLLYLFIFPYKTKSWKQFTSCRRVVYVVDLHLRDVRIIECCSTVCNNDCLALKMQVL
jgi:cellulose synthase/poly-beta-1,6-N-acetylglucosamine synthase-like glycosyltransferase